MKVENPQTLTIKHYIIGIAIVLVLFLLCAIVSFIDAHIYRVASSERGVVYDFDDNPTIIEPGTYFRPEWKEVHIVNVQDHRKMDFGYKPTLHGNGLQYVTVPEETTLLTRDGVRIWVTGHLLYFNSDPILVVENGEENISTSLRRRAKEVLAQVIGEYVLSEIENSTIAIETQIKDVLQRICEEHELGVSTNRFKLQGVYQFRNE